MSSDIVPSPQTDTDRWLKVWAESTTDGLWDAHGQMIYCEDLPLTQATRARLAVWSRWIDDFEDYLPPSRRTPPAFPLDDFNAEGQAIAAIIQSELPDWTVVYCKIPLEWSADV